MASLLSKWYLNMGCMVHLKYAACLVLCGDDKVVIRII